MPSLHQAVAALLRDIDAALAEGRSLPHGTRLEADRITLTLQVHIDRASPADNTLQVRLATTPAGESSSPQPLHSITFELRPAWASAPAIPFLPSSPATPTTPPPPAPAPPLAGDAAEPVIRRLAAILGAPGFDSAARASVLCEAWSELTNEQAAAAVAALLQTPSASNDPAVQRARHLLAGVVKSGPAQSLPQGAEILGDLLQQHSAPALIDLVQREWKSQDAWLG